MPAPRRDSVGWLCDRLGLGFVLDSASERRVTGDRLELHLLGSALCLVLLAVTSGVLLLMHYRPSDREAHASIVAIGGAIPFGALVRGVHAWTSHLLVAVLLAYVFALLYRRAYTAPRELSWASAVVLLALTFALALTGSVLTWSADAHSHAALAGRLSERLPGIGPWLQRFVLGGDAVGGRTLQRAFGFHVAVLPAAMTVGAVVHGMARRRAATREAPSDVTARGEATLALRDLLAETAALWAGLFFAVLLLATFAPPATGAALDGLRPASSSARPAWYFLGLHHLLAVLPGELLGADGVRVVATVLLVGWVVLVSMPLIDRRGSPWMRHVAVGSLLLGALLTASAAVANG
jgi:quinol-cytochrome oxidoreductase complex cytochrome b subunit